MLLSIVVVLITSSTTLRSSRRVLPGSMQICQTWLGLEWLFIVEKDRITDRTVVPTAFQGRQIPQQTRLILIWGCCLSRWQRSYVWHITTCLVLVKAALSLTHVATIQRILLLVLRTEILVLTVRVIDEAFLFEKVAPTGFSRFVQLG